MGSAPHNPLHLLPDTSVCTPSPACAAARSASPDRTHRPLPDGAGLSGRAAGGSTGSLRDTRIKDGRTYGSSLALFIDATGPPRSASLSGNVGRAERRLSVPARARTGDSALSTAAGVSRSAAQRSGRVARPLPPRPSPPGPALPQSTGVEDSRHGLGSRLQGAPRADRRSVWLDPLDQGSLEPLSAPVGTPTSGQ